MKTFGLLAGTLSLVVAGWLLGRSLGHAFNQAGPDASRTQPIARSPQAPTKCPAAGTEDSPLAQRINSLLADVRADDNPAELSMRLFDEAKELDSAEFGVAIATLAQSTDPNAAAAAISLRSVAMTGRPSNATVRQGVKMYGTTTYS